jgi:four helix bundle protein
MPEDKDPFDDELDEDNDGEDGDFNPEDYFDDTDDDELSDEELERELDAHRELPVFKKAEQIRELTMRIIDTFDDEKDIFKMKEQMMLNACTLSAKIAGAEGGDLYTLRMENAVVIKMHARELQAQTSLCKAEKLCNQEYLQLLRDEIEEFRKLFVEWVNTFDKSNDIQDEWGLFYD